MIVLFWFFFFFSKQKPAYEIGVRLGGSEMCKRTSKIPERSPERVVFPAVNAPAKMDLLINLKALSADSTELTAAMDVDIPPFLKSMVGGSLQKAVDQFGGLMGRLL